MSDTTTVLIADDHPLFRSGLRALLESTPDVEVVGEASSGEEAVALAAELLPDTVVMDLHMPGGMNGVLAARQIARGSPAVQVLILTMFDDEESVFAAMRAGAAGYLLKDAEHADVVRAVVAVARGDVIFGPGIAQRVRDHLSGVQKPAGSPFPELTAREMEILDLIATGANNATIARRLGIATKTVRNASSNIFLKLQVADRAEAMIRGRDAGLGNPAT